MTLIDCICLDKRMTGLLIFVILLLVFAIVDRLERK